MRPASVSGGLSELFLPLFDEKRHVHVSAALPLFAAQLIHRRFSGSEYRAVAPGIKGDVTT